MTGPCTAALVGLPVERFAGHPDLAVVALAGAGASVGTSAGTTVGTTVGTSAGTAAGTSPAGGSPADGAPVIDVVVVRALTARDLGPLQRAHAQHPEAGAVVVVADDDAVRSALRYTPGIPTDLDVVADDADGDALAAAVLACGRRAAQRRRHRAAVVSVTAHPVGPRPTLRPTPASLGAVLDHAPIGVVVATVGGEAMTWNARAATMLGLAGDDTGTAVGALFAEPSAVLEAIGATATTGGFSPAVAVTAARRAGGVVELNAAATELDDGRAAVLLLCVDVTGRRAAEAARDELRRRLEVVRRSQEFLLRASDVLAQATDVADTLNQLAAVAVPTLADLCIIDVLEHGRFRRAAARHADPAQQPLVDEIRRNYPPTPDGPHPAARALRERRTAWHPDIGEETIRELALDERHFQLVSELRFSGYVAVPLLADGEVLGIVTLIACGGRRRLGPDDVALAEELAGRVALVIAKARRYDREHEIALALQRSMLSELPDLAPWQVSARYVPAAGDVEVGGDWYDAFAVPGAAPVVVIGDVVGHDVVAAAAMGQLRSALRALAFTSGGEPARVLTQVDSLNEGLRITDFATLLVATLERTPAGGRVRWASAGHPPPLVLSGGTAQFLPQRTGPVLGMALAAPRLEQTAALAAGATILLYTDGLVERRRQPVPDGMARLAAEALHLADAPLDAVCDTLVERMAGDAEDDVALLAVRVPPAQG